MTVRSIVELMPPGTMVCGCGYLPQINTRLARHPRHVQRLDIQMARQGIEVIHEIADVGVAVDIDVLRFRLPGPCEARGWSDQSWRPNSPGPAGADATGGRGNSSASARLRIAIPSLGGRHPMAISVASAEQVEWTPPHTPQARLVMKMASRGSRPIMITSPAEQRGHRARLQDATLLEVSNGVERERAGDARHRIEVD